MNENHPLMAKYIIRRLLWVIVLLFLVSLITFIIFYLLPSADPATLRAGRQPNPAVVAQIRHNLGLDQPWYTQYFNYMKALVLHFNFGYSYTNNVNVRTLIFDRLPATISLTVGAAILFLVLGIARGHDLGCPAPLEVRPGGDGHRAGGDLGPRLLARAAGLFLFAKDIGKIPIFPGASSYVPIYPEPDQVVHVAAAALDRARGLVRGDLRPAAASQPDRGDVRGLHPHGPGQGPARAPGDLPPRDPRRRSRRS